MCEKRMKVWDDPAFHGGFDSELLRRELDRFVETAYRRFDDEYVETLKRGERVAIESEYPAEEVTICTDTSNNVCVYLEGDEISIEGNERIIISGLPVVYDSVMNGTFTVHSHRSGQWDVDAPNPLKSKPEQSSGYLIWGETADGEAINRPVSTRRDALLLYTTLISSTPAPSFMRLYGPRGERGTRSIIAEY